MPYFRKVPKIQDMLTLFQRDERWLICISADPDAMASALALSRIMSRRVKEVVIAKVNEVSRPDNLAMVRYCRIDMQPCTPELAAGFQRYAIVDSQPHHHPFFETLPFSIVIDHHPLPATPYHAPYYCVKPEYGATSSLLVEHLYSLGIRPGKLLATAMQFGIKTDTNNFERHFIDTDIRVFNYLSRFSDHTILSRILRSEFHFRWLKYFALACNNCYSLGSGQFSYVGKVDNTDILVNIADFFMRVYEIRWVAVAGVCGDKVTVIFRSDGIAADVGTLAGALFGSLGSAGGHKTMARAEFPLEAVAGQNPEIFVWRRFKDSPRPARQAKKPPVAEAPKVDKPAPAPKG